ncbi:MAG: hypothetical protein ACXITV_12770 [Luteibaculaceae bacterium]
MRKSFLFFFALVVAATFTACNQDSKTDLAENKELFPGSIKDSILTDIITYVGRKHRHSNDSNRFDPMWRHHYLKQLDGFELAMVKEDEAKANTFYFYMIRPARTTRFTNRAIGGVFITNAEQTKVVDLVEYFNTVAQTRDSLLTLGTILFAEMLEKKEAESLSFINDKKIIEWPNQYSQYDLKSRTWRAVDLLESNEN